MDNFNIFNYADTKQLLSLVNGLLQNFPDSVYYKALPDFRFVAVNQEKASHCGATLEDMIGKTDFDYLPLKEAKKEELGRNWGRNWGQPLIKRMSGNLWLSLISPR